MLLAIVADGLSSEQRQMATAETRRVLVNWDEAILLRVYDFDELKDKYGIGGRDATTR